MHTDWSIIILAGGKGTRMGTDVPKPLVLLGNKPLIAPIIEKSLSLRFREVVVVVSEFTQSICERFTQEGITYVRTEPLGTGHAVAAGLRAVTSDNVIIAQADDSYFYTENTLQQLMRQHLISRGIMTVGVVRTEEALPYASTESDARGRLLAIKKSKQDLLLPPPKDIAAGLYATEVSWVRHRLPKVTVNSKGEVSFPPVIDMALAAGEIVTIFHIPPHEWFGVNTPEELKEAQRRLA